MLQRNKITIYYGILMSLDELISMFKNIKSFIMCMGKLGMS